MNLKAGLEVDLPLIHARLSRHLTINIEILTLSTGWGQCFENHNVCYEMLQGCKLLFYIIAVEVADCTTRATIGHEENR